MTYTQCINRSVLSFLDSNPITHRDAAQLFGLSLSGLRSRLYRGHGWQVDDLPKLLAAGVDLPPPAAFLDEEAASC